MIGTKIRIGRGRPLPCPASHVISMNIARKTRVAIHQVMDGIT
jgi:hypothetical protein